MIELYGDIWEHVDDYNAVVITTNGYIKKNGELVMGRGIAAEAKKRYPLLPKDLGDVVKDVGNRVATVQYNLDLAIISLPVKPEFGENGQPGWKAKAQIPLIEDSVKQMVNAVNYHKFDKIIMPRPGCGNGGLKWEDVKPVIEPYLDDRFTVMEFIEETPGTELGKLVSDEKV